MMTTSDANQFMFRRLVRRLLFANRGRLFVVLLALSAGAAVSAALLNLQVDAKRRISADFRSFGPNVVITPRQSTEVHSENLLDQSLLDRIPGESEGVRVTRTGFLYLLVSAYFHGLSLEQGKERAANAILVGSTVFASQRAAFPAPGQTENAHTGRISVCHASEDVIARLHLDQRAILELRNGSTYARCIVIPSSRLGEAEDYEIFTDLDTAQELAGAPKRLSQIQLTVSGTPEQIRKFVASLPGELTEAEVRPLRPFTDAQSKIYSRISGLLTAATTIILILTALCVMAAMTNIAAERKQDVGMMKAIGGSARSILNLFLTEAVLLGLIGGLIGATAGIALSMALGKAVFGVAAAPRLIVYPIAVSLTVIVAILGAYPLRMLANVRPANIFRGEA
jgi:putative ABC transport system permease protein